MIDIFNKKKVKELERKINYQDNILEEKTEICDKLQCELNNTHKIENRLIRENRDLIQWIRDILENFGTYNVGDKLPVAIPIYKVQKDISQIIDPMNTDPFMELKQETIIIPEIRITKYIKR